MVVGLNKAGINLNQDGIWFSGSQPAHPWFSLARKNLLKTPNSTPHHILFNLPLPEETVVITTTHTWLISKKKKTSSHFLMVGWQNFIYYKN